MKFQFENRDYYLSFARRFKQLSGKSKKGAGVRLSKFPYTTAYLQVKENDGSKTIVAEKEVGCFPDDKFSNEIGRVYALRALTPTLSKALRTKMWEAYMSRFDKKA